MDRNAILAMAAISLAACGTPVITGPAPKGPVEQKYRAAGPWAVSTATTTVPCDRKDNLCDIWYPTNLGSNPITGAGSGFKHPIIAWGNGTGMQPSNYAYYLEHLASWGFIVVATRDGGTSTGGTMLDTVNHIIDSGNASGDIFFGKVDGTNVGATGHSQGGSSVDKLAADNVAPFKAFVPINGPDGDGLWGRLCCQLQNADMGKVSADKSILFLVGTGDAGNTEGARKLYTATAEAATKAIGVLVASKHDDIMGSPDCPTFSNCAIGVYGFLGYSTAWFMWKLQGAADVQAAFRPSGEFRLAHSGWDFNDSNVP